MFYDDIECNSVCFYVSRNLIRIFWCHREKSQLVFASRTESGTPSDTQYCTPSGTPSCTKTMGDLAVMVLAASDGRIRDMGFSRACGLQLLNS
jgi:hypothetical protein